MENVQPGVLTEILTEKELLDLLGIEKSTLDNLRRKQQFPFCKLSNNCRVYLVKDILNYMKSKRTILNRCE